MKINSQKISIHRSYTIQELSGLLDIDKKTCSRWMDQGLKIIPGCKKPILIKGNDLKEFLNNRKAKRKISLKRNEFFCTTCKEARYAKRGSIEIVGNQKKALCRVCNGKMNRIF